MKCVQYVLCITNIYHYECSAIEHIYMTLIASHLKDYVLKRRYSPAAQSWRRSDSQRLSLRLQFVFKPYSTRAAMVLETITPKDECSQSRRHGIRFAVRVSGASLSVSRPLVCALSLCRGKASSNTFVA